MIPLHSRRCKARAFTLIELLVVVSIIAILASLALAAFSGMTSRGQQAECTARLRAIAVGIQLYAADNDALLPTSQSAAGRWPLLLAPYMQIDSANMTSAEVYGSGIFKCPTHDLANGAQGVFGLNPRAAAIPTARDPNPVGLRQIAIEKPSRLVLLSDTAPSGGLNLNIGGPHPSAREYGWTGTTSNAGPAPNHDGLCNFLFADGHVESHRINDPTKFPWSDRAVFEP